MSNQPPIGRKHLLSEVLRADDEFIKTMYAKRGRTPPKGSNNLLDLAHLLDNHDIATLEELKTKFDLFQDMLEALKGVVTKQEQMLSIMRENNLKIDDLDDPMQKLAFTFYTEICDSALCAENLIHRAEGGE